MTNKEAAEMIHDDMKLHHDSLSGQYRKALNMAISALQAQEAKAQLPGEGTTSDLISRQDAIDALHTLFRDGFDEDRWWNSTHVLAALEGLPSAQPERKKGKWNPLYNGKFTGGAYWFQCSSCNRIVPDVRNGGWNFCPNCGADMREETDAD